MKVSIITTCYNRETTIRDSIESVLAQNYDDMEYIIVDGNSRDGSIAVIEEAMKDRPVNVTIKFISEPDHGMYEAINKGIRMSTGEIIGLVHSDDMLYDNHVISDVVRKMSESGAEFLYGNGIFVDKNNMNKVIRKWNGGGVFPVEGSPRMATSSSDMLHKA